MARTKQAAHPGNGDDNGDNGNIVGVKTKVVPVAEIMRQRQRHNNGDKKKEMKVFGVVVEDVDDEIRRLEAELAQSESEDDSDDDDSMSGNSSPAEEEERRGEVPPTSMSLSPSKSQRDENNAEEKNDIICLSRSDGHRIKPLPSVLLPNRMKRKKLSVDDDDDKDKTDRDNSHKTNRKKKKEKKSNQMEHHSKELVQEMLSQYKARSSERLPFYCRVCAVQCSCMIEFQQHKTTDLHRMAVAMNRRRHFAASVENN